MQGSIVKKLVGKKKKPRYYVVVDLPTKKGEKRKQKWVPAGTTKKEAQALLPQILLTVKSKYYLTSQTLRFRELASDYLFMNKKRLATATYKRYAGIVSSLDIYFGEMVIGDIEPYHVEQYTQELLKRNLSGNTIAKYRMVLNQICTYAMEIKVIHSIPIPKTKYTTRSDSFQFQVWNQNEAKEFLLHIKDTPLYMPVFIAIHTGMRLGEILALKWSEVDLKNNQITVRYSVDVNGALKTTKTKQSRRTIKLIPSVVAELSDHRKEQKIFRLKGYNNYKNDFVCTFKDGKPLSRNYVSCTFPRKITQLNFSKIRFHDLRHSFATIALSNNVHTKVVQDILGHVSSRTTLDVYSHVIPSMQTQSLELLTKAFNQ